MTDKLMKGHPYSKGAKRITFPAVAEVKVDEVRLDVRLEGGAVLFRSYADKPLHNLGQFEQAFRRFLESFDTPRLDMGVLVNKTFADTYRYVRSSKGVPADLLGAHVEFILFDIPGIGDFTYAVRQQVRTRAANLLNEYGLPVSTPIDHVVRSHEEIMALYDRVRGDGYEGLMLKSFDHLYEVGKRSYGWLKVKPEDEADAKIIAVNQAHSEDGTPLDRAGSVQVECEDGSTAAVGGFTHDVGRALLANPSEFIGQWLTFTYMERDRQGGYRHPRFERFREAKA